MSAPPFDFSKVIMPPGAMSGGFTYDDSFWNGFQPTQQPGVLPPAVEQPPPEQVAPPPVVEDTTPPGMDQGPADYMPTIDPALIEKLTQQANSDPNWGKAIAIGAIAMTHPELAFRMLESDEGAKKAADAMLTQLGIQEAAGKRDWNRQGFLMEAQDKKLKAAEARQEERLRAAEETRDEKARSAAKAQIVRAALDNQVDISDLTFTPKSFDADFAAAQSRITQGAQGKDLLEFAAKKGIPTSDIDISKGWTKETVSVLKSRVDDYQEDLRAQENAYKIAQSSPTGINPNTVKMLTDGIKNPQIKLETLSALEAAMEEGRLRRAQLNAAQENINSQIQARKEANELRQARENRLQSIRQETDSARTLKDADLVLDRAADNLRSAQRDFEYYQSPGTQAGVIEAQEAYDKAKRRQQALLKESNPAFGQEATTFNSLYQSYKYPNPNKPDEVNEWGMSGEEFEKFIFNPSNQDDPVWNDIFESMWRDFDSANNDLGDPAKFIAEFNSRAGAWAAQTTKSNWFFNQQNLSLTPAALNPEWMTNPGISTPAPPPPTDVVR